VELDRNITPVVAALKACEASEADVGRLIGESPQSVRPHAFDFAHVEVTNAAGTDLRMELATDFEPPYGRHVYAEVPRGVAARDGALWDIRAPSRSTACPFSERARWFGGGCRSGAASPVGRWHCLFDQRRRRWLAIGNLSDDRFCSRIPRVILDTI
jgi:hypothetical protein